MMKCLTNNQIQQLIDGELSANELREYKLHIETCPDCAEKYTEQKALSLGIKSLLNEAATIPERIPDFQVPAKTVFPKRTNKRIPLWAKVAAVLIPLFFVWNLAHKPQEDFKPTPEEILMYETSNNVDANTAFQENMITTTVTDENGKVIKCETN
jgi:hypothetical protein